MARQSQTLSRAETAPEPTLQPTVLDHIREFRARLFWVVGSILVASSGGYLIKDEILAVLTHPLGDQQLYYLTPIGGLSFIIKLSFYFGVLATVPLMVYHLYRYLQPLMGAQKRPVKGYFAFSFLLAVAGICFAYFVSLPAALHFLTDFNIKDITAMLTVDAYLSFVTSYLLGAALLFQIPLILLIIDKINPLTPGGLMKYQRHVILVAFIIAAIISPTPDIINQALLAGPIIVMYQFGILLVWFQHSRRKRQAREVSTPATSVEAVPTFHSKLTPIESRPSAVATPSTSTPTVFAAQKSTRLISDFGSRHAKQASRSKSAHSVASSSVPRSRARQAQPLSRAIIPDRQVRLERARRLASIDGIIAR